MGLNKSLNNLWA